MSVSFSMHKSKEGNHRRITINEHWNQQKAYTQHLLSEEKTGGLYRKRKIDVEPVFGFLKANLGFTRFSVRRTEKVKNEIGFAFMAVNMRKYTANRRETPIHFYPRSRKKISLTIFRVTEIFFVSETSYVPASISSKLALPSCSPLFINQPFFPYIELMLDFI